MYQRGKIYKLVNDEMGLTYYGSTCNELRKRFHTHKSETNRSSSKKLFEKGEVQIILVEKYPCNDKMELLKRERYYIENNECVNKNIPLRTDKEYYNDNKEKYRDYYQNNKESMNKKSRDYHEKNKESMNKKQKEKFNCECGGKFTRIHKATHLKTNRHQNYLTNKPV
jgi:hypothetical protein